MKKFANTLWGSGGSNMYKNVWLWGIISLFLVLVIGCSNGNDKGNTKVEKTIEATKDADVDITEETTEPRDTSNDMNIMTEDELLEITGNEWTSMTDEEKFDAVSNFMYIMSEENDWNFEYSETEYVDLIDNYYADGHLDVQFAGVFSSIKALEENQ